MVTQVCCEALVYGQTVVCVTGLLEGVDIKESISYIEELINRQVAVGLHFYPICTAYLVEKKVESLNCH